MLLRLPKSDNDGMSIQQMESMWTRRPPVAISTMVGGHRGHPRSTCLYFLFPFVTSCAHHCGRPPLRFCSSFKRPSSRPSACWVPTLCAVSVAVMSIWAYFVEPLPSLKTRGKKQKQFNNNYSQQVPVIG